jgi:Ser/Thr protein kinase RdoA (MazF antagonist)
LSSTSPLSTAEPDAAESAAVADVLAASGRTARAVRLLGGSRNRLFLCATADGDLVVRLARIGEDFADPANEVAAMRAAAVRGAAPAVLWADASTGAFVVERAAGRTLDRAALRDGKVLQRVGRALARVHDGPPFPGVLDPAGAIARYAAALDGAADVAAVGRRLWNALAPGRRLKPCHNDPVPANLIDDGHDVLLVDWEFAGQNDPAWDLAYVAIEGDLDEPGLARLLAGYGASNDERFAARVRVMRVMVQLVNGLWDRRHGGTGAQLAAARVAMDSETFSGQVRAATAGDPS